jgi:hypothetical protein
MNFIDYYLFINIISLIIDYCLFIDIIFSFQVYGYDYGLFI